MNPAKYRNVRQTRDRVRKHRAIRKLRKIPSENDRECSEAGGVHGHRDSCENIEVDPAEPSYCDVASPADSAEIEVDESSDDEYTDNTSTLITEASDGNVNAPSPSADGSLELEDESNEIRRWAIENNITQVQLDSLLLILRRRLIPHLPKTAKTFLKTSSASYNIRIMESSDGKAGEFVYFGIADHLRACINVEAHPSNLISLQINVDGLPLFKSSNLQLWPILFKIVHESDIYKPLPIAIYAGYAKPKDVNEFLAEFILEMNDLSANGIFIDGRLFEVGLQCFICDTPARSFLKCVKGHSGYFACERCDAQGCRNKNSIVYPEVDSPKRTDRSFRCQSQRQHHKGISVLLRLWPLINMIAAFILDFMHLCCIGIMKKLLNEYWLFGNLYVRLGRRDREKLSHRLEFLKPLIPSDFQRKPRSVTYIAKWKATELRFFLLYCGPVVLKGILNQKLYKHFLLFHAACRILCHEELALKYNKFAKKYLISFVLLLKEYYGINSQVMNAHNLIHLADDVKNHKCNLSKITAFPFESALGRLKKYIRTPNQPLAQICRRLHELSTMENKKPTIPPLIAIMKQSHEIDQATNCKNIFKLKYKGYLLSTKSPDDTVLLKSGTILKIEYMTYCDDHPADVTIYGRKWKKRTSLLKYPCDSKFFQSWTLHATFSTIKISCSLDDIDRKMVIMRLPNKANETYVMSLLHDDSYGKVFQNIKAKTKYYRQKQNNKSINK